MTCAHRVAWSMCGLIVLRRGAWLGRPASARIQWSMNPSMLQASCRVQRCVQALQFSICMHMALRGLKIALEHTLDWRWCGDSAAVVKLGLPKLPQLVQHSPASESVSLGPRSAGEEKRCKQLAASDASEHAEHTEAFSNHALASIGHNRLCSGTHSSTPSCTKSVRTRVTTSSMMWRYTPATPRSGVADIVARPERRKPHL